MALSDQILNKILTSKACVSAATEENRIWPPETRKTAGAPGVRNLVTMSGELESRNSTVTQFSPWSLFQRESWSPFLLRLLPGCHPAALLPAPSTTPQTGRRESTTAPKVSNLWNQVQRNGTDSQTQALRCVRQTWWPLHCRIKWRKLNSPSYTDNRIWF